MKLAPLRLGAMPSDRPEWFGETPVYRGDSCPNCWPNCAICEKGEAVTGVNGYGVCSEECAHKAEALPNPAESRGV